MSKLVLGLVAVCGLLVIACGGDDCPPDPPCLTGSPVSFYFSCPINDVVSVIATGPCSVDAGAEPLYALAKGLRFEAISAATPGTCHIVLTFVTGFTYAADVTFTEHPGWPAGPGCRCASYLAPSGQSTVTVNNPPETCVATDAGILDGALDRAVEPPADGTISN